MPFTLVTHDLMMLLQTRTQLLRSRQRIQLCALYQHRQTSRNLTSTSTPRSPASPASSASYASLPPYESTLKNLLIGPHTRVIFQGFTGRQATANARESLEWGTNIVGGVKPGSSGEHLGLPVLPSVRAAMETLKPDATGIYVPAALAPAAIEEAIEAEVPLVVAVAEHIPLHAMLRIHSMLRTQSATRLVGANSPGIISATGRCRIGFQPLPCFNPGDDRPGGTPGLYRIGIAARSGTLSYEAVASTSRAGLSQTLCIGVGGDIVAGTDLREGLAVLADHHPETDAIALIGEIGGDSEMEAAAWITAYHKRTPEYERKPIVALVGGTQTHSVPGRIMGHAGAFTLPGEPTPQEKIAALERVGATVIDHPEKFGQALKARLDAKYGRAQSSASGLGQPGASQRRGMHTSSKRPQTTPYRTAHQTQTQKRFLTIGQELSFDLLRRQGVNAAPYSGLGLQHYLAISIDRSAKSPCVLASSDLQGPVSDSVTSLAGEQLRRFPFDYRKGVDGLLVSRVASHLKLDQSSPATTESLRKLLRALYTAFIEQEAHLIETSVVARLSDIKVVYARMSLDDVAFAKRCDSGERDATRIASTVATTDADPLEVQAKTGGIVYVTLDNDTDKAKSATDVCIGTLVNGAGLAMNTVDALVGLGGRPANFLDTGGKATSETVKLCFQVLLQDPRVRVIFVNVFGGLTLGDMIARGVLLAFQEVDVTVPVVVRIRGTNEAEGQAIIQASGLKDVYAFDGFQEAAAKAIELAKSN